MRRLIAAKTTGFVIGLFGFLLIPVFLPDASLMLRFGVLFWYTLLGGVIGLVGVMDRHPMFHFRMNAWFRGIVIGGFMNLTLVLIAFDQLSSLLSSATYFAGVSPFWLILEGALVGLIADLIATKYGGEGPGIVAQ